MHGLVLAKLAALGDNRALRRLPGRPHHLITICPQCALRLAVTAADLRIAQGQVRCGRCQVLFNALVNLHDDDSDTIESEALTEDAQFDPAATNVNADPTDEPQLESQVDDAAAAPPIDDAPVADAPIDDSTIDDSPIAANDADIVPLEAANDAMLAHDALFCAAAADEAEIPTAAVVPDEDIVVLEAPAVTVGTPSIDETAFESELALPAVAAAPRRPRWMLAACVALATLLSVQWLHARRNQLATLSALNGPLTSLYAALGQKLTPAWDLGAYEVRQRGAEAGLDNSRALLVRATISNRKTVRQPLPYLRVTLQDRYGNRVAARDFTPHEYLHADARRDEFMSAGARVDTELQLLDSANNAVGFELDVCLPRTDGRLACSMDLTMLAPTVATR